MTPLLKKLNFKEPAHIVSLNHPKFFEKELAQMKEAVIVTEMSKLQEVEFAIVFVTMQKEINAFTKQLYPKLKGDAVVWFCYPKGTSKKYTCDFNRDTGWTVLGNYNMEPVRQVAIDKDWSALRFRKVEFIKTLTRRESFAISQEGKKRTTNKGK